MFGLHQHGEATVLHSILPEPVIQVLTAYVRQEIPDALFTLLSARMLACQSTETRPMASILCICWPFLNFKVVEFGLKIQPEIVTKILEVGAFRDKF